MNVEVKKKRTNEEIINIIAEGLLKLKDEALHPEWPDDGWFEGELLDIFSRYAGHDLFSCCTYVMSDLMSHPFFGNGKEQKIFKKIFGVDFFELFNDWDDGKVYKTEAEIQATAELKLRLLNERDEYAMLRNYVCNLLSKQTDLNQRHKEMIRGAMTLRIDSINKQIKELEEN